MHILLIEVDLHLPGCHSLKEKRSVLKKLLNEIRRDYNLSVAEVEHHDTWQSAGVAMVGVSGVRSSLERLERQMVELLDTQHNVQLAAV